ncbi:AAA domain-containing protein [Paenalcaligenes niemegkensis]|uniref:AAA domain-containing protein n=1 Tax=Paenalcaligenes niemegkensis TaxID=2895469 RepID=UPI001EE8A37A|nr:AAA domain-containing protein [Paenalcaligenes niemegkensis]MCQ9616675.1 AAA domain-containing protein [Paenalcaligenes niemegkensis]
MPQLSTSLSCRRFASYYRVSCLDGQTYQSQPIKDSIAVSLDGIKNGYIPDEAKLKCDRLRHQAKQKGLIESENDAISVVIQCATYVKSKDRGFLTSSNYPNEICAIVTTAMLTPDGQIIPSSTHPMVPRELLGPSENLSLALVNEFDGYLAKNESQFEEAPAWSKFIDRIGSMQSAMFGSRPLAEGYESVDNIYISLQLKLSGMIDTVVRAYDRLERLDKAKKTPLFDMLVGACKARHALPPSQLATISLRTGQMKAEFSLASAQRDTLGAALNLQDGEILALNGPPGTGKTTLLQSVVASLFTRAALLDLPAPLIVGASANNQAVTNIIESFSAEAETPTSEDLLAQEGFMTRWLPRAGEGLGFGLYMASKSKAANTPYLTPDKFDSILHGPGAADTERHYVQSAQRALNGLGKGATLQSTIEHLKKELQLTADQLNLVQQLATELINIDPKCLDSIEGMDELLAQEQQLKSERHSLEQMLHEWMGVIADEGWVQTLLASFGPFKRKRQAQLHHFLSRHQATLQVDQAEWSTLSAQIEHVLAGVTARYQEGRQKVATYQRWVNETRLYCKDATPLSIRQIDERLDVSLRAYAFWLAVHIFEGRWIQEMKETFWSGKSGPWERSGQGVLTRLRLKAMLTPCLVSTFHSLPQSFKYIQGKDKEGNWIESSFFNEIDLLIVDEAGQISPEIAAGSFALAKKALIVGDTLQIEPVWSVPDLVDKSNWVRFIGGPEPDASAFEAFKERGAASSNGSLMRMAQEATAFSLDQGLPAGMYLFEHRRCVEPIIEYCNDLCYQGMLSPQRAESSVNRKELGLPAMGWAYVQGASQTNGSSRSNPEEAKVIAVWVAENLARLKCFYGKPIEEILAVVTPFKAQMSEVRAAFRALNLPEKITIGTVHALQGAERDIVLFSTVYTLRDGRNYFFDQSPNMLNVAVSRAKDSFLVFGDTQILDERTSKPSGVLAKHLFSNQGNEIIIDPSWSARQEFQSKAGDYTVIRTLEGHRQALKKALGDAQEDIIIVSPWITHNALEQDGILNLLEAASKRNVRCTIFYDKALNEKTEQRQALAQSQSEQLVKQLKQAGAHVHALHNLHAKEIFVDDCYLLMGSFNWLSSPRGGPWVRHEVSTRYQGPLVGSEKKAELDALMSLKIKQ